MFPKGSNWNGWMERQWEVVPKRQGTRVKSSCTSIGLYPRDWQTIINQSNFYSANIPSKARLSGTKIIIVVWCQWTGRKRCGKHGVKINRLFFTQGFVGQQIDLKQHSKPYWQPMKGTKQWKTASIWRRLCHHAGQLILYTLWSLVRSMSAIPYKSDNLVLNYWQIKCSFFTVGLLHAQVRSWPIPSGLWWQSLSLQFFTMWMMLFLLLQLSKILAAGWLIQLA